MKGINSYFTNDYTNYNSKHDLNSRLDYVQKEWVYEEINHHQKNQNKSIGRIMTHDNRLLIILVANMILGFINAIIIFNNMGIEVVARVTISGYEYILTWQILIRLSMVAIVCLSTAYAIIWGRERYTSIEQISASTAIFYNAAFRLQSGELKSKQQEYEKKLKVFHELGELVIQELADVSLMLLKNDKSVGKSDFKTRNVNVKTNLENSSSEE